MKKYLQDRDTKCYTENVYGCSFVGREAPGL